MKSEIIPVNEKVGQSPVDTQEICSSPSVRKGLSSNEEVKTDITHQNSTEETKRIMIKKGLFLPERGLTLPGDKGFNFKSTLQCLQDEDGSCIRPIYQITCVNTVTGEIQTCPGKIKGNHRNPIKVDYKYTKDGQLEFFATVAYGNYSSESFLPMYKEKDAEQLAACQALKDLELIPKSYKFDVNLYRAAHRWEKNKNSNPMDKLSKMKLFIFVAVLSVYLLFL